MNLWIRASIVSAWLAIAPARAVIDGQPVPQGVRPEVFYIYTLSPAAENRSAQAFDCTGTLISDRVILTAAHCAIAENPPLFVINASDSNPYNHRNVRDAKFPKKGILRFVSSRWGAHPLFKRDPDLFQPEYDIGLIELEQSITPQELGRGAAYAEVVFAPSGGKALRRFRKDLRKRGFDVYGYGVHALAQQMRTSRRAGLKMTAHHRLAGWEDHFITSFENQPISTGDSGGPAYLRPQNGAPKVFAVCSGGTAYEDAPLPATSYFALLTRDKLCETARSAGIEICDGEHVRKQLAHRSRIF